MAIRYLQQVTSLAAITLTLGMASPGAFAQDAPPPPPAAEPVPAPAPAPERGENGRRISNNQTTTLAFDNVPVSRLIPFIVEATGKVVLPRPEILTRRVTVISDRPLPQSIALDYVFLALQQDGVGIVETNDLIIL